MYIYICIHTYKVYSDSIHIYIYMCAYIDMCPSLILVLHIMYFILHFMLQKSLFAFLVNKQLSAP